MASQRLFVVPPPATDSGRQLVNAPGKLPSFLIPKTKLAPRGKLPKYNVDIEERPFSIHFPEAHSIGFFLPMHIYQPPRFGTAERRALVMASLPVPVGASGVGMQSGSPVRRSQVKIYQVSEAYRHAGGSCHGLKSISVLDDCIVHEHFEAQDLDAGN